ncbi:GNAT family N-acetyltransferase [Nocardioides marmoribigeumensis]|uniref:RimJ/RimL family protein N-acetyltransferase n=1 Tax=Nocardioides marmoribigeumensis TaxID=433649 RepID=A0ABU2BTZ8_9ACTN|nr:GNAT family N-acetyltransferase [Nocardioides marmoribigeumensis]MDR7362101.1 RimJ/RimL family protein N-acetyltransferase [Nocardioides marmoribigeumensis]
MPDFPLRTARLDLRPHRPEDLDDLLAFHSDPDVVRYVPWPVRDRAATEETLRTKLGQGSWRGPGQWMVLAVELRETATVIGEVLLKHAGDQQGELGFALAREHQGRGYAAEAARELLRVGFDELGLHRVTAVCIEENHDSARLLQRLGFRREARTVDSAFHKGAWVTQLVYGITEVEWRAGPPATDDVADVLAVVRTFFAAFTSGGDVDARIDALRAVLLPQAVVVRTCGLPPAVYDVTSFLEPRRALLSDGTLVDFSEHAVQGRVDVFGDVAHWFGSYEKDGFLRGEPGAGAGMKSVQLVRTPDGWRVSAAAWDDERDGLRLGDHVADERYV